MSLDVNKRFLVLSLGLVFALSFIWSLHVVSANQVSDTLSSVWSSIFSDSWKSGALDIETARWAYFILLAILIWAILDYSPFFSSETGRRINPFVALIVSYLAMAYLTPAEVYTALISYGALGIVLGGALPFIILAFFSIKINKEGGLAGRLLSKFMWFAFIIFLVARLFMVGTGNMGIDGRSDSYYAWAYFILILFAVGWIVRVETWVIKFLRNEDVAFLSAQELDDQIAHWQSVEADWRRSRAKDATLKADEAHKRVVELTKKRAKF